MHPKSHRKRNDAGRACVTPTVGSEAANVDDAAHDREHQHPHHPEASAQSCTLGEEMPLGCLLQGSTPGHIDAEHVCANSE